MKALSDYNFITIDDYLRGEEESEIRHEYINGQIYAMVGSTDRHNLIAGNIFARLHSLTRSTPCKVFMSDLKVQLTIAGENIFYYPDIMLACDPDDHKPYYRRNPCLIIEVLSPSTERIDRREKFLAYTTLPSLQEYILVSQEKQEVTIFRQPNDWQPQRLGPDDTLHFLCLDGEMPISQIYDTIYQ